LAYFAAKILVFNTTIFRGITVQLFKRYRKPRKNVWDTYNIEYRCSRLEFQISSRILKTKRELSELIEFQAEASTLLKVFYSEITLGEAQGSPP
jgi:hypothetical protein